MSSTFKPPNKRTLQKQYQRLCPLYERLCEEVIFIIEDEIKKSLIKTHGISHRVKTFDSFYNKIVRKEISAGFFTQICDIAGVRITCLYRSDLEAIGELISRNFDIISSDTSRTLSENSFGYMADHYVVKLSKEFRGTRYDEVKSLQCEIQVRTILMDAWASVSHHLDYKRETDIPSSLKKDFNAVSGLLYAADTHFELFKEGIEKSKATLSESVRSDKFDLNQEINMDSLRAYLNWKLPHREKYFISTYSDLVADLKSFGYERIIQLDRALQMSGTVAESLEEEEMHQKFYSDTGFVRICLMLYDKHFYEVMKQAHQRKNKELFELIDRYRHAARRNYHALTSET
jgi:ppGpp synthetase/RelA/SpoT-type nucleotidyltranferase